MKRLLALVAGISIAGPTVLAAQASLDDVASYSALTRTPAGGLPPMLTNMLIDRMQNGASLALRYGYLQDGDFNSTSHVGGLTGILPIGLSASFSLTAGAVVNDNETTPLGSNEKTAKLMLGLGGDVRLVGATLGEGPTATLWTISATGEFGYSNRAPGSFTSLYFGLPVALVPHGEGMQFVPFVTPGIGFGWTSQDNASGDGAAFMLGGGLGVYNAISSVIINLGAQHVFKDGAQTMVGVNLVFGGR